MNSPVKPKTAKDTKSCYDTKELAALASKIRVAVLVAAKLGIITVHTGANPEGLNKIFKAIDQYGIGPKMFVPTHINRKNPKMTDQALTLAKQGAFINATGLTAVPEENGTHISAADFALTADKHHVFEQLCFSTDLQVKYQNKKDTLNKA